MWEWLEENSGGNLGVCFYCPEKRPWSLDQDSRTEKWVTLRDISILCGVKKGNYCGKLCESSLDLWADGVAIYNEREQEKRSRWVQLKVSVSYIGVQWAVGYVAGTQKGDLGYKNLRKVNTELAVTETRELYQSQKGPQNRTLRNVNI